MECNFKVGQKVVCIKDNWHPINAVVNGVVTNVDHEVTFPKTGSVYTIRQVHTGTTLHGPTVALRFVEVVNAEYQFADVFAEPSWVHWFFRPLQERATDISIFKQMLTPNTAPIEPKVRRKVKENVY